MELLNRIWDLARNDIKRIVLPEGEDRRTIEAARKIKDLNLAHPILIGDKERILQEINNLELNCDDIEIIDPNNFTDIDRYIDKFYEIRRNKGVTIEKARIIAKDPMYFGTLMVKCNDADGLVSGAVHTTGDLLRPGLQIIKTTKGASVVSSFFIMGLQSTCYGEEGMLLFADCAVNPNPNYKELAEIAITTADTAKNVCKIEPRIAMLSFSTMGSADHEMVEKVRRATELVKELRPDLLIDGEMQLDAAIVESVAKQKAPNSIVAGKANILVFPDLQSGNIGYKLVQRFANAEAVGPICQGFDKPINDLSRGCSVDDIVNVVALTVVQAQNN